MVFLWVNIFTAIGKPDSYCLFSIFGCGHFEFACAGVSAGAAVVQILTTVHVFSQGLGWDRDLRVFRLGFVFQRIDVDQVVIFRHFLVGLEIWHRHLNFLIRV